MASCAGSKSLVSSLGMKQNSPTGQQLKSYIPLCFTSFSKLLEMSAERTVRPGLTATMM